jgi:hypothetical protein
MMTSPHTRWCGRGHHCNMGEHRSHPIRWQTPYGSVVATLVDNPGARRTYLELRASIAIPANETAARRQAAAIATGIDATIRRAIRIHIVREVRP